MAAAVPVNAQAMDLRILQSIPTPVADALLSRGCKSAADVISRPESLTEALMQHHIAGPERASNMLAACRREAASKDAWSSADSALSLLRKGHAVQPLRLPSAGLNGLLGNALQGGGSLLEVCGLPGSGKTQFCLQLCAAAQISQTMPGAPDSLAEAIYVDTEGSFVPERYMQICEALLAETRPTLDAASAARLLEAGMRRLHVCRAYDATELYSTVKQLGSFIKGRPRVRALVVDSIAFSFRHELMDNTAQRARVLADLAATLRRCGAEHGLVVVVTNHMTTRFDRDDSSGWLAPALGETWAHQPSTQLRLEKTDNWQQPGVGRATLTKSVEQATGLSCLFRIERAGLRDHGGVA
ncbi:Rad51c, partial [Symbiodinium pilosum]